MNVSMHALIGVPGRCLKNGGLAQGPLHAFAMVTGWYPRRRLPRGSGIRGKNGPSALRF